MRKVILGIAILISNIHAELNINIQDAMVEGFKQGIVGLGKGVASNARYITGNQTPEEKCKSEYFKIQQRYSMEWWNFYHENNHIKKQLKKKNIHYDIFVKRSKKNISVDTVALKEKSCSQKNFDYEYENIKKLKIIKKENKLLRDLAERNQIVLKKPNESIYDEVVVSDIKQKERERQEAKDNLKMQMAL